MLINLQDGNPSLFSGDQRIVIKDIITTIFQYETNQYQINTVSYKSPLASELQLIMSAAPSLLDLSLMERISHLAWKDKLQQFAILQKQIPEMDHKQLHQIEKCFLLMLDQNNVNVVNQVLSLIKAYSVNNPITQIPVEEVVTKILNFHNVHGLGIQEIIGVICRKSSRGKILEAIGEGFSAKTFKKVAKSYDVLSSLIKQFGLYQLMYLQGAIQDISVGFFSISDQVKESVFNLMKVLYSRAGSCILHYAKFMKYPLISKLQQFANEFVQVVPFESFPERMLYKQFSFHQKYPEDFLDQVPSLKVKELNECLKQMKEDSEKKNLKQQNFIGIFALFIDLAKRRTPSTNKLIVSILNNLSVHLLEFDQYSQTLVEILFELVGCKQILEILEGSQFVSHLKFEHIEHKVSHLEQNQVQYCKAIKLFKFLYKKLSEFERDNLFGYLNNLNINYVYKLELQTIYKKYEASSS